MINMLPFIFPSTKYRESRVDLKENIVPLLGPKSMTCAHVSNDIPVIQAKSILWPFSE